MTLAPQPVALPPTSRDSVLSFVSRLAVRQNLEPLPGNTAGVYECFGRDHLTLCAKAVEGRVDFRMIEALSLRWSARARSVRQELVDSLRASFGEAAVRDCDVRLTARESEFRCTPLGPLKGH